MVKIKASELKVGDYVDYLGLYKVEVTAVRPDYYRRGEVSIFIRTPGNNVIEKTYRNDKELVVYDKREV